MEIDYEKFRVILGMIRTLSSEQISALLVNDSRSLDETSNSLSRVIMGTATDERWEKPELKWLQEFNLDEILFASKYYMLNQRNTNYEIGRLAA